MAEVLRVRGEFQIPNIPNRNDMDSPEHLRLTIAETYVGSTSPKYINEVMPLAARINPYLQRFPQPLVPNHRVPVERPARPMGGLFRRFSPHFLLGSPKYAYIPQSLEVARHMVGEPGCSVAYYGMPESVVAFSFLQHLGPELEGEPDIYVFRQFGVTRHEDLRELNARGRELHLGACAATMYCAVEGLGESPVYVEGHPHDRRDGYFFEASGFKPTKDSPAWGEDSPCTLVARADVIRESLMSKFSFLPGAQVEAVGE